MGSPTCGTWYRPPQSNKVVSEVPSVPSLSRLDPTISGASAASLLGVCSLAPGVQYLHALPVFTLPRLQVDDTYVMRTLRGTEAVVPKSLRICGWLWDVDRGGVQSP